MTGSLFSGLKSKVKGMDNKNSASQDSFDGIGGSKNISHVADNNEKGVVGEKLKKEDSDFDHVERGSMLQDMRASRAKAPKKRPPSSAINIIGDNNNSLMNGSNSFTDTPIDSSPPQHNDDEQTKPKPRGWEKHKAPWMEELKASQMKKTSPNSTSFDMSKSPESAKTIDSTTTTSSSFSEHHDTSNLKLNDMSKSFSSSYMSSNRKSSMESSNSIETRTNNNIEIKSATLIQKEIESQNQTKKSLPPLSGTTKISIIDNTITSTPSISSSTSTTASVSSSSSLSSSSTSSSVSERVTSTVDDQTSTPHKSTRPLSVNLRNRSISPTNISATTNRVAGTKTIHVTSPDPLTSIPIATKLNHHHHNNDLSTILTSSAILSSSSLTTVTSDNVCSRVSDFELRVSKLEKLVQMQTITIDDLVKTLRDEKDKVKILKTELEKYAQCVTQV